MARTTREALLAVMVLLAACRTVTPPVPSRVPDPTQPPLPGAALTAEALTAARAAVAAAERGDARTAERALRQLPPGHPVTRLVGLELRHLQGQEVSSEALALARAEPRWAAGWMFVAQLAVGRGDAATELVAARQLAALQPQGPWRGRVASLALEGIRRCYDRAGGVQNLRLHGDCHPGNVLWTPDGPHFVDFDDSRMGPAVQDLWMLLSGDRAAMNGQLTDVLAGYEDFFEFDPRELLLV